MIAYLVTNRQQQQDTIVVPEIGCSVPVDCDRMKAFISVSPDFATWSGDACEAMAPEDFGDIVAIRDDCGDVRIFEEDLWREKMEHYLGRVLPANEG
ncbi:MAG: hypothetical protein AMJ54_03530 [Deltaproteobacteria bacterium SG8_13]|nr:MAG: hypothetical protein AMJ54_03530 [Deltaproteobacteria bacterium SG8_13]